MNLSLTQARTAFFVLFGVALTGCGGSGGGGPGSQAGSNRARFTFDVDLQGVNGVLVMEVELVNQAGIVWGPGVTPDITAVITTGTFTLNTAGTLNSPTANYIFTGQNDFADFTDLGTAQRFLVQWIETPTGMTMVANPFGPGPVQYDCVLTSAVAL